MYKFRLWLILFCLVSMLLDKYSFINKIRTYTTIYIQNKFNFIIDKVINYPNLLLLKFEKQKDLEQENNHLKQQLEKYSYLSQEENNILIESNAIKDLSSEAKLYDRFSIIVAKAIIDINYLINDKLLIDKGTINNVDLGLAVINKYGVIGQVSNTFNQNSQVTLITNPEFKIYVQTTNRIKMLAQGISNNKLIVKYINKNSSLKVNDILYTTGLDNIYPNNIPVAKITKIFYEDNGFNSAICEPIVDFNKIQYIVVLKNVYN
jgi:rod shape-determining protein MreC